MSAVGPLGDTWQAQADWSAAATRLKKAMERTRSTTLVLVVGTALIETLAAQFALAGPPLRGAAQALAIAGAVLAAVAAVLQGRSSTTTRVSEWIRVRAVSEALKEQVFRYLAGVGAYAGADRDRALLEATRKVRDDAADLDPLARGTGPTRELPPVSDVDSYVKHRVEQQIDGYYRPRSRDLAGRRAAWQRAQTALLVLTAALGAVVAYFPDAGLPSWVAVLTTIAGAFGAHVEAARYDHLAVGYRATATRLEALRDEWKYTLSKAASSPAEQASFVDRCEDAISVENQAWVAGWSKSATPGGAVTAGGG